MSRLGGASPARTEEALRQTLSALATGIQATPPSYRQAQGQWQRRYRRRRLILAILIAVVFVVADAIGLWALNHTGRGSNVIFDGPVRIEQRDPAGGVGPP